MTTSGLSFPLKPNRLGRLGTISGTAKIQQNLEQIVNTSFRERAFEDAIGSYGVSLLFKNRDESALLTIAFLLEKSLNEMEPRATSKVTIPDQETSDTMTIVIQYIITADQSRGRTVVEVI